MEKKNVIGAVRLWKADKGYGFIKPNTALKDVFLHIKQVERSGISTEIEVNQQYKFDVVECRHRSGCYEAANLRPLSGTKAQKQTQRDEIERIWTHRGSSD
jgi:cold shock protein